MNTALNCPSGAHAPAALAGLRYLLGVDGGGTGTRVRLSDLDGRLLGLGEAGPSALGQGSDQAWRHVHEAVQLAAQQAGIERLDPVQCAMGLGMSGSSLTLQVQAFFEQQPGYTLIALDSDGWTTVLGAHAGQPGAVIASGTGSIGEALRRDGSRACVGGWGWVTGDEGSGAWLGLKAIRHTEQALDGRAVGGALAQAVVGVTGADRGALQAWNAAAKQTTYAGLARLVFDAAPSDPFAAGLVAEAVAELEKLVHALDPSDELPLALSGSIALRLAPEFSAAVQARCVPAKGDSAMGGLHLARAELQRLMTTGQ